MIAPCRLSIVNMRRRRRPVFVYLFAFVFMYRCTLYHLTLLHIIRCSPIYDNNYTPKSCASLLVSLRRLPLSLQPPAPTTTSSPMPVFRQFTIFNRRHNWSEEGLLNHAGKDVTIDTVRNRQMQIHRYMALCIDTNRNTDTNTNTNTNTKCK